MPAYHDPERISPIPDPKERRPSYQESERKSPFLEAERRSSVQDMGRRSPFERERKTSNSSERKHSASSVSDQRSSVSSDRRGSVSPDRRHSSSSERRPSLSDIGRRTSISYEPGQHSPFFDFEPPVFEFDHPVFADLEPEKDSESLEPETSTSTLGSTTSEKSPMTPIPKSPTEKKIVVFDGMVLDDSLVGMEAYTESLLPSDASGTKFTTKSGVRVVEVIEGQAETQQEISQENIQTLSTSDDEVNTRIETSFDKSIESLKMKDVQDDLQDDIPVFEDDVIMEPGAVGLVEEVLGAVGGTPEDDYYDEDDDRAHMSDHSSQSPVSEPDEYRDDYQEPDYFHGYTRQIDVGYAFPSRTLSRISERSTTSEQEQEQDHIGLPEPELEHTDSKISTPTEEKQPSSIPSVPSEEQQGEMPSDLSNSTTSEENNGAILPPPTTTTTITTGTSTTNGTNTVQKPPIVTTSSGLTDEEQVNVNKFATQLFLRDLPEFAPGDDSDEFPSPPSSAFLENPHTELSQIETYYIEVNQRAANSSSEGIYDNIPVKFEGIHEVSESESASEDNHTLQEPESIEEPQAGEEFENDGGNKTPTIDKPGSPSPPPPPPPRPQARLPSKSSPSPPRTPPTPIAFIDSCDLAAAANFQRHDAFHDFDTTITSRSSHLDDAIGSTGIAYTSIATNSSTTSCTGDTITAGDTSDTSDTDTTSGLTAQTDSSGWINI